MNNEGTSKEENELEGQFKYHKTSCFCCTKLIVLHFVLNKTQLNFYTDQEHKDLYLMIPRDKVIAINKRQIDRNDVFKFSIYYQLSDDSKIKEIKLKATSRGDTDRWISTLRKAINPKKYEFKYDKTTQEDANLLFPYCDTRKQYLALCHLEYILCREKMMNFFEYYFEKKRQLEIFDKSSRGLNEHEAIDDKEINIELKNLN